MIFDFDVYDCMFTVKLGDTIIQQNRIQAPSIMIQQQFMGLAEQIAEDSRPLKVCISFVNEAKYNVCFGNSAYTSAFPNEFKD